MQLLRELKAIDSSLDTGNIDVLLEKVMIVAKNEAETRGVIRKLLELQEAEIESYGDEGIVCRDNCFGI